MKIKKVISEYKFKRVKRDKRSVKVKALLRTGKYSWTKPCFHAYRLGEYVYIETFYGEKAGEMVFPAYYRFYSPEYEITTDELLIWR